MNRLYNKRINRKLFFSSRKHHHSIIFERVVSFGIEVNQRSFFFYLKLFSHRVELGESVKNVVLLIHPTLMAYVDMLVSH
jgi:putative heme iron utilization protein